MFSYLDPPPRPEIPLQIASSERYHDPLVYIDRQTKHLQRQIQSFLDAQSDGLLASMQLQLGQDGNNDTPSKEGSVATASTVGSGERRTRTIPVRQPAKKKIGLQVARKGILRSMSDLLDLREEENRHLQARIHEREDAIQKADKFAEKRNGLLKTLSDLENDREGTEVRKLKKEANDLEEEIRELELKLVQMKTRHRSIIQEVFRIENAVDAKLSSYKESLAILETEIRRYLETDPIQPIQQGSSKSPFYSLHPSRRTLEMAREHWQSEKTQLEARIENVNAEIVALDDGGEVWQTVVKEITHLEKRLRAEMQQTTALLTSSIDDDLLGRRDHEQKILEDLENTTSIIEKTLELAKAREWNLLVCSIGTEVAALHEAQNMLRQMYHHHRIGRSDPEIEAAPGTARNSTHDLEKLDQSENNVKANDVLTTDLATAQANKPSFMDQFSEHDEHADDLPADLLRDTVSEELNRVVSRSEDEDDEPDPAWLLSDA